MQLFSMQKPTHTNPAASCQTHMLHAHLPMPTPTPTPLNTYTFHLPTVFPLSTKREMEKILPFLPYIDTRGSTRSLNLPHPRLCAHILTLHVQAHTQLCVGFSCSEGCLGERAENNTYPRQLTWGEKSEEDQNTGFAFGSVNYQN